MWKPGTEERERGVRPTHPPPVPQGPCLVPLVLKQKGDFVHRKPPGTEVLPPTPHPHTSPLHCCQAPLLLDLLKPSLFSPLPPLPVITSYLPAFTEGETERCHRGLAPR